MFPTIVWSSLHPNPMTKKSKDIIKQSEAGECFQCANTGFLINKRVFFDHAFLKSHSLVSLLDGLSFMDWNNALAYCRNLVNSGSINDAKFFIIYNHVREQNGIPLQEPINFDIETKPYPKDLQGEGPSNYIAKYAEDRLTSGEQTVSEYKSWLEARNKDVPKVETQEQKEKKLQNLRKLKTRHNLNFEVWVPASSLEKQDEAKRISEIEEEEKKLAESEPDPKTGKRKALTKQKQSAKRRKISGDGMKRLDWITSETKSMDLLTSGIFSGAQGQLKYTIKQEKDAEGQSLTVLAFSNATSGATMGKFVLPGEM